MMDVNLPLNKHSRKVGFLTDNTRFALFKPYLKLCGYEPIRFSSLQELQEQDSEELRFTVVNTELARNNNHTAILQPTIILYNNQEEDKQHICELLNAGALAYAPNLMPARALIGMLDTGIRVLEQNNLLNSAQEKVLALITPDNYPNITSSTTVEVLTTPIIDDIFWRLQNNRISTIILDPALTGELSEVQKRIQTSYPNIPIIIADETDYRILDGRRKNEYTPHRTLESALDNAQQRREEYIKKLYHNKTSRIIALGGPRAAGKTTIGQLLGIMVPSISILRRTSGRKQAQYEFVGQEFLRDNKESLPFFAYTHRTGYDISFSQSELDNAIAQSNDAIFTITNPNALDGLVQQFEKKNINVYTILVNAQSELLKLRAEKRGSKLLTVEESGLDTSNWDERRAKYDLALPNTFDRYDNSGLWGPYNPSPDMVLDIEKLVKVVANILEPKYSTFS